MSETNKLNWRLNIFIYSKNMKLKSVKEQKKKKTLFLFNKIKINSMISNWSWSFLKFTTLVMNILQRKQYSSVTH